MSDFAKQALALLQTLPSALAALLMQQVLRVEVMFPPEKHELEALLAALRVPRSPQMQQAVAAFQSLRVPSGMSTSSWQTEPAAWLENFTAAMWSTGQIDAFRNAAKLAVTPQKEAPANAKSRVVVIVYDNRLQADGAPASLFRRLRPAGTLFTAVQGARSSDQLRAWLAARAATAEEPYRHWSISGDTDPATPGTSLVSLTYAEMRPARHRLLTMMNEARKAMGTGGPEGLRHAMQALTPNEMGLPIGTDPVLRAFATDMLVGGSGTQLYATTFVQWTAREVLRRTQPQTLVARFTARNQSTSMDNRLANPTEEPPLDFAGSLVDAEMGAHLTYLNLLRLPGAESARFLTWHEGYGQAMLVGGGAAPGRQDSRSTRFSDLLLQIG